jgi:hypothetical protein
VCNYLILNVYKIEVRARNEKSVTGNRQIMRKCRIWQVARAGLSPESGVGKWMLQCTQGRANKLCASVVCVTICKFFHGMTGKLKQLATEKGPTRILMRG